MESISGVEVPYINTNSDKKLYYKKHLSVVDELLKSFDYQLALRHMSCLYNYPNI